ncbi:SDR family oxidoreductase [Candidatus Methylospira mobilis]|uniref:SDR family oxidoreductase n=1 Tax=Candidatus Methylospira mobilis TaxID=1808979 RepID=A0A5Q0BPF9_9GAMM|nr:SDR family oxidoreductase [Candidatus Methylospira mobilis]QFY43968.1 SDR family oxidoreductase [Candidatus Methylospira mobilis]WNV04973.1 SDR family oxidoreductase [Candidatus Methylospira mobilis]
MKDKICLVTGATAGIGKETALGLAKLGAHVAIAGRDEARTRATAAWLARESANNRVDFFVADCSSLADVRRLGGEVRRKYPKLDVLLNNAGALFMERELTVDGFERTWALNHLAYVLLTHELLPSLKASESARIVNVASIAHRSAVLDFDNLQGEKSYGGMPNYRLSKLANVMFTNALARRLKDSGVTVNSLHPGVVSTNFGQNNKGWLKLLIRLIRPFFISAEEGAKTSIHLASSKDVEGVSGQYFSNCRQAPSSALSLDEAKQETLWEISLQQAGLSTW